MNKIALYERLVHQFSTNELTTLMFKLSIDPEEIAGDTKSAIVRGLIEHCEDRGRLDQLVVAVDEARPLVVDDSDSDTKLPVPPTGT